MKKKSLEYVQPVRCLLGALDVGDMASIEILADLADGIDIALE